MTKKTTNPRARIQSMRTHDHARLRELSRLNRITPPAMLGVLLDCWDVAPARSKRAALTGK